MFDFSSFRKKLSRLSEPQESVDTPMQIPEPKSRQMHLMREAKYQIGQVVRHRLFPFRGVIFDVDPEYANTEEWYEAIPEKMRPHRDQPYYHIFAENEKSHYTAYVSEQNLVPDETDKPVNHPEITDVFELSETGEYQLRQSYAN